MATSLNKGSNQPIQFEASHGQACAQSKHTTETFWPSQAATHVWVPTLSGGKSTSSLAHTRSTPLLSSALGQNYANAASQGRHRQQALVRVQSSHTSAYSEAAARAEDVSCDMSRGQDQNQPPAIQPWKELPPVKGTLRGVFHGNASEEWFAREVQQEVNDLALCVDAFSVLREEKIAQARRSALQQQCDKLIHERGELAAKVAQLEVMLPEHDGGFRKLKAELLHLEQECDKHFARLQLEISAKKASEDLAQELRERVRWLESHLTSMGVPLQLAPPPAPGSCPPGCTALPGPLPPAALTHCPQHTPTHQPGQVSSTYGPQLPHHVAVHIPGGPQGTITPEDVLASVAYLRSKGELPQRQGLTARRTMLIRVMLLVAVLLALAACILLTHFLTKNTYA